MTNLTNITVNGVPLKDIIKVAERAAVGRQAEKEIAAARFIVNHSRPVLRRQSIRNLSGGRTKPGRVIYSRQEAYYGA